MAWSSNAWKNSDWYDNEWKSKATTGSGKGKADDPSGKGGKADENNEEQRQARIRDIEARVVELADEQWTCINFSIRLEGQKYADIFKQRIAATPEIADEEALLYIEKYATFEAIKTYGNEVRKAALTYADTRTAEIKERGLPNEVNNALTYMVTALKRRIEESEK